MSPDSSSVSQTVATCDAVKFNVGNANNGLGANIGWWWWWWWAVGWPRCDDVVDKFSGLVGRIGTGELLPPAPFRPTAIEGRTTARLLNMLGAILKWSNRLSAVLYTYLPFSLFIFPISLPLATIHSPPYKYKFFSLDFSQNLVFFSRLQQTDRTEIHFRTDRNWFCSIVVYGQK